MIMNNYAILIECDNTRSLGQACQRDTVNIRNRLLLNIEYKWQIFILTFTPEYYAKRKITENVFSNILLQDILKKCVDCKTLYIHISGHGYNTLDNTKQEVDGRSEYIVLPRERLMDFHFYNLLRIHIPRNTRLRITVDTCHSGTFSNFQYQLFKNFSNKNAVRNPKPYFTNAWSISSCTDQQQSMNDIGNISGFGGSLTVHLLDTFESNSSNACFERFVYSDKTWDIVISCLIKLEEILIKLRQVPILLTDTLPN